MNTLKQQLQDFGYTEKEADWWKEFTEKWLTQKRQEIPKIFNNNSPHENIMIGKMTVINELLEELEK
jgi:hypothetical protein